MPIPAMVTVGVKSYPEPPFVRVTDEIVPPVETVAVAVESLDESCEMRVTEFWNDLLEDSFAILNNGLTLSTYAKVEPIPTDDVR